MLLSYPNSVLNMYVTVDSSSQGMDHEAAVRAVPMLQSTASTYVARNLHCYPRVYSGKL